MKLTGTTAATKAHLDFHAELSIEYAQHWLHLAGGQKVPASGVIRRALAVYVRHLADANTEPRHEFSATRAACQSSPIPSADQQQAREPLEALAGPLPLPPFANVRAGYDVAAAVAETNRRADALFNHIAAGPRGRMRGVKPVPTRDTDPAQDDSPLSTNHPQPLTTP